MQYLIRKAMGIRHISSHLFTYSLTSAISIYKQLQEITNKGQHKILQEGTVDRYDIHRRQIVKMRFCMFHARYHLAVHAYRHTGKQSSYPGVSTPYFPASHVEVARST